MSSSHNLMFLGYYFHQPVQVHFHKQKPCENVLSLNRRLKAREGS